MNGHFISLEPVTFLGTLVNITLWAAIGYLIVNYVRNGKSNKK